MSLNLQQQIRENTFELQSFLADLNQWTGDVKEKDKALREGRVQQGAGSSQAAQRAAPPPIRGRAPLPPENAVLAKPLTREKKDDGSSAKSGSAAAHTYDSYRERWEKFDVDAALKEVESADAGGSTSGASDPRRQPSSQLPTPQQPPEPQQDPMARIPNAPLPPTDPAAAAEALKQEGNEAFKGGDYGLAVTHYTASIAAQPTAVTFANRAMARLKLGQPAEAEADCTQAIALDPRYLKAYQRRSAARRALSRLLPAIEDCEAALRLEPASKVLREERTSLIRDYQAAEKLTPTAVAVPLAIRPLPAPAAAPPEPAPQAPQAPGAAAQRDAPLSPAAASSRATTPGAREPTTGRSGAEASPAESPATHTQPPPPLQGRESGGDAEAKARADVTQSAAAAAAAKVSARPLPVPRNGTEFEKAWRSAASDPGAQVQLLGALEPASLPALLKDSLTGPVLKAVLKAALGLLAARDIRATLALLQALVNVPRFSLAVMSLSSKDKPELSTLWGDAEAAAAGAGHADVASGLGALRPQFRL